jgi:sulfate permease, SulP family
MSSPSLARWIPALNGLRDYDRTWLRGDVLAGVTFAAYLLPAALGDASLANEVTAQVHG